MDYLKSASFGGLFTVTFFVAATFQVTLALLGLVAAIFIPGGFQLNGAPARNTGEAIAAVAIMLVAFLLVNVLVSAAGSGLWLAVRRFLPRRSTAAA